MKDTRLQRLRQDILATKLQPNPRQLTQQEIDTIERDRIHKAEYYRLHPRSSREAAWRQLGIEDTWSYKDYLLMLKAQDYKCLSCGIPLAISKRLGKVACVDHNHKTGKVRGIICNNCNRANKLGKD